MISLTATELPRFMACNGSRLLGGVAPFSDDRTSADEGDATHWLIEQAFNGIHGTDELVDRKAPNGVFITAEMSENVQVYLTDIIGHGLIEAKTSYRSDLWEIRGRADHISTAIPKELIVSDYKNGWRIVEPEENWTLIWHAVGFLANNAVQGIETIRLRIYQPRPFHARGKVREWVISYEELISYWGRLKDALENPHDFLNTSKHCYKCPKMSQCPAHQIALMNAIDVSQSAFNSELDNVQLNQMLDDLSRAEEVLKQGLNAYEELAKHRLRSGESLLNYTLMQGEGRQRWKEGNDAEMVKMLTGVDVSKKDMLTPKQAKAAGISEDVLATLTETPSKGVVLVRQDINKKAQKLLGNK